MRLLRRLMLRPAVLLLIARWKRLGVARQIRLCLRHRRLRCKAWFIDAREGLAVVVVIEIVVSRALGCGLGLRVGLVVVVGVLLAELFLRNGD